MAKAWFSIYDFSFNYKGDEPAFIVSKQFEWASDIGKHVEEIKRELSTYLKNNELQSYFNTSMVSKNNSWKTIALKTWSIQLFKNQKQFPITTNLLNKYPQIVSASFNMLDSNSNILPHCGDTNAIYRCHLGLDIPIGLPDCGFKVKDEIKAWENNKWLIFIDAYPHEAWNNSSKERYILLIDVIRNEFIEHKKLVCFTVLTSLFLQKRNEKYQFSFDKKPRTVKLITKLLIPFTSIASYISNKLKLF